MTRLDESHLRETRSRLAGIDALLQARAGLDLRGVALRTIGVGEGEIDRLRGTRVVLVPLTLGGGIIRGFGALVCAIVRHVGLQASVTAHADVAGLAEAFTGGHDILVLADDVKFIAVNLKSGAVADNDRATGEGFAVLLDRLSGGVQGRVCGVIGCGPVGTFAAWRLVRMGAEVTVCDRDAGRRSRLAARLGGDGRAEVAAMDGVAELLERCRLIVDASPAAGIIGADDIRPDTVIAAPGVPVGLTPEALEAIGPRFYHDNLPLGVATMVLAAVYGRLTATLTPA